LIRAASGACIGSGSSRAQIGDLLGADFALVEKNALYRCLDKLLPHKEALFSHLRQRWQDLFGARFDVLLYDLTSTYFESPPPDDEADKRRHGYSRDKRSDCVQVVIALIVTPDGFPLGYEVLAGNTSDKTTLRGMLRKIEARYGKANRIWVMDRGIPAEDSLAKMRAMGASYPLAAKSPRTSPIPRSKSPGTFSTRTNRGRSSRTSRANSGQSHRSSDCARRYPVRLTGWHGKSPARTSTGSASP
jgi:hypothetical protein